MVGANLFLLSSWHFLAIFNRIHYLVDILVFQTVAEMNNLSIVDSIIQFFIAKTEKLITINVSRRNHKVIESISGHLYIASS